VSGDGVMEVGGLVVLARVSCASAFDLFLVVYYNIEDRVVYVSLCVIDM
jgi:hypothetical protein